MLTLSLSQYALGAIGGSIVGISLGLIGGGGSILAVPLMIYLVGIDQPHIAIGTSALAVAANAGISLINHARRKNVRWPCALIFAVVGVFGAFLGSSLGKMVNGQRLLMMFAILMLVVSGLMVKHRNHGASGAGVSCRQNAGKLSMIGGVSGVLSGFFGIGGGFLVVPGLIVATRMPALLAVGTSLVAVTGFGLTTAINYSLSGMVDWPLALVFIGGGNVGGVAGAALARRLSHTRGALNLVSAATIALTGIYTLYHSMA
ncbi:sulfite exporter TauE/SafE family protein [Pseudomonas sp. RAC1]|uniref:sulfite exporter TauE/SafE family protein n=1 Tax=Pseudomonas sp. RAC1 TaxID=3064900 RepID=UPI0027247A04|nr:sulfite exporter TauE/SafE family protein [Pseudomonas sp. RAC1]MDV9033035.1 sulfite exporter TauE/SafE family protein [Pseudomonas sp. RAC1]